MRSEQTEYEIGMTLSACLWAGFFPLLQGGSYAHITKDKWNWMLVLSAVTLACFLFGRIRHRGAVHALTGRASRLSAAFAAGLLAWTVLSCLLSSVGPDTWWLAENARLEGLASQLCYMGLFFCFFFSRVNLKPVFCSAAAGAAVYLAVVLLQREGGNPLGLYPAGRSYARNPEFQGTVGNVDMATGYLCMLSGLFLHGGIGAFRGRQGSGGIRSLFLPAVCALGFAFSVYLIVTMKVQFGLVSLAVLFLLTLLRLVPRKKRLLVLVLLLAFVLLVVWFWPGTSGGIWELHEILHGRTRLSFGSNRLAVWLYSLRLVPERPLLGGGSGTFPARFSAWLEANGESLPVKQGRTRLPHYFDNPHNEYLARLTDHGIPAVLLFIALLLVPVFRKREGLLPLLTPCSAAVVCYAVQAFFSFSVCLVAPLFWVLLGISLHNPE